MKNSLPLSKRLTATMLKRLYERKITNAEAAEKLGVSETYLSRTVAALQDKVPGESTQHREAAAKLYATRTQLRKTLARKVVKGRPKITIEKAAQEAGCSVRTMFRYVAMYRE